MKKADGDAVDSLAISLETEFASLCGCRRFSHSGWRSTGLGGLHYLVVRSSFSWRGLRYLILGSIYPNLNLRRNLLVKVKTRKFAVYTKINCYQSYALLITCILGRFTKTFNNFGICRVSLR